MITALIHADGTPVLLARTLASLVPGAVEGLVRDVVVVGDESEDLARVASDAGCPMVSPAAIGEAIGQVRGEWLLIVQAGTQFLPGWVEGVADYLSDPTEDAARFTIARPARWSVLDILRRDPPIRAGILVRRSALPRNNDLPAIARAVRARRRLKAAVRLS